MLAEPIPLRQLIEGAGAIAIVRVTKVGQLHGDSNADQFAVFTVERLLFAREGRPESFTVKFHSGIVCPPAPHYSVGERRFVVMHRYRDTWSPSYFGDRSYERASDYDEVASRVLAYLKVIAIPDQTQRKAAVLEWLVESVACSTTRSDALDEIAPEYILINEPGEFAAQLTADQLNRLVKMIPQMRPGYVPGLNVAQLALLMGYRRHASAVQPLLLWVRKCPTTLSIGSFIWIAKSCAELVGKPKCHMPYVEDLVRTRSPNGSGIDADSFFTLVKRRSVMISFVNRFPH